jgi:hypothetical protein
MPLLMDRAVDVHPTTGKGAGVEPLGPKGDNPGTAGPGPTGVRSETPENAKGRLNPSAPEDANMTPGSTGKK